MYNRLEDAKTEYKSDPEALEQLEDIEDVLAQYGYVSCPCQYCTEWDGIDKRCCCGNLRLYWYWNNKIKQWYPETY